MAHAPVAPGVLKATGGHIQAMGDKEIKPELVGTVTSMERNDKIHPTRAVPGEVLSEGYSRNCTGFFLCNNVMEVEVDQDTVKKDSEYLQNHAIVAYFVGGKQFALIISSWIDFVQKQVGDWVGEGRDMDRGFFQIMCRQLVITQKVLTLTPHKFQLGIYIVQSWTPRFNAARHTGLRVPTWVTLKNIPSEFLGVDAQMANNLGELLRSDKRNALLMDQRFCIGLSLGSGWKTSLFITNAVTRDKTIILIDYCNLSIQCRFCMSTSHLVKYCRGFPSQGEESKAIKNNIT
uniref:Uncharacterized protein n=1 Tax=Physcomitrium patens TaxID=3218 RepID=A0A2K1IPC3_PHYPA|nr:hypothetical protein PHYPA_027450 [Physcomitrium patens]